MAFEKLAVSVYRDSFSLSRNNHGIDLYVITEWTKPLQEQFPNLAPMAGVPADTIRGANFLLIWPTAHYWLETDGPDFNIVHGDMLYGVDGQQHERFSTFDDYVREMLQRSTGILWRLPPIQELVDPLIQAVLAEASRARLLRSSILPSAPFVTKLTNSSATARPARLSVLTIPPSLSTRLVRRPITMPRRHRQVRAPPFPCLRRDSTLGSACLGPYPDTA